MTAQERAIEYVKAFEQSGRPVKRVVIEGKRIEVEFAGEAKPQNADNVEWKP